MVQNLKCTVAAQAWADKLVNDWKGPGYSILHHAPNSARPGQGENIAYNFEADAAKACVAATKAWYDEIKDYNYASPGFGYNTGHFTQVRNKIIINYYFLNIGCVERCHETRYGSKSTLKWRMGCCRPILW